MVKYSGLVILIVLTLFSCLKNNHGPNWKKIRIGDWDFNQLVLPNKTIILCDSNYQLVSIESLSFDTLVSKLFFSQDGLLSAKERLNTNNELDGKNYYFHENGDLKSIVTYKHGKKIGNGFDYYKNSGNLQNESYADTSIEVRYVFNPNNPNSYKLIKVNIPDPQKSKLLRIMEEIGLDSLKQNY
jgi:hypothetical protein